MLLQGCRSITNQEAAQNAAAKLENLYEKEYYFRLRDSFEHKQEMLTRQDFLYFGGLLDNAFYRHERSNEYLVKLLKRHEKKLTREELKNVHMALFMNYYNLYEYSNALQQCNILIADHEPEMDSAAYKHLFNDQKILGALENTAPQVIHKLSDSHVSLYKDKMGLVNINLGIKADTVNFLFDTGSSFSFIKRSIAQNAEMKIYDVDFTVEGATGAEVICDITVLDTLKLGNLVIENSIFWVFDDKDVTLPEYDYSVNGAIAFPILKAMEEIHLYHDTAVYIPSIPAEYDLYNLAINDLDPIICVVHDNDTLPFYFDTGASFSSLYKPFYDMNAAYIDTTYEQKTFTIGSLGGVKEFTCYIIDSTEIRVGGKEGYIRDIETHTASIYNDAEKVFGNLGQDFIYQFDKMIISTRSASVVLE